MRLRIGIFLLLSGFLLILGVSYVPEPTLAEKLPPEPVVNLIAYVTMAGEIRTIDPDGFGEQLISPDDEAFYTWPTWSRDGRTIVFSGIINETVPQTVLLAVDLESRLIQSVHSDTPGFTSLLAPHVIHYQIWSPDNTHLAFITNKTDGLTLLIDDRRNEDPPVELIGNGPLWITWSSDSRYLLAHRGDEQLVVDTLADGITETYGITVMNVLAERYRVPAWSPIENRFAYVERNGGGDHVITIGSPIGEQFQIDRAPTVHSALSWSPDGAYLAVHSVDGVINYLGQQLLIGEGFRLYKSDGELTNLGVGDVILAMFWSPDGTRIAYVTPPDGRGILTWRVYDVLADESRFLTAFIPSDPQLVLFSFFDQYSLSHSPWSPDGNSLVFAGMLWREVTSASEAVNPKIIVLPVDSPHTIRLLTKGLLAVWSPR